MRIGDARLDLVLGTRNDLYHRMEEIPAIRAEREAFLRQTVTRDSEGPEESR